MLQGKGHNSSKNKKIKRTYNVTLRDFLEAVEIVNKFINFGERAGRLLIALAKSGVDINSVNPYDFQSLFSLAMRMKSQGYDFNEEDLVLLKEEFEEILDLDINEVKKHIGVINKFASTYRTATSTLSRVSKNVGVDLDQMNMLASMLGIKLPHQKEQEEVSIEETGEEELSEEEKREFEEVIKMYKEKKLGGSK